jgi:uncharacterized protein
MRLLSILAAGVVFGLGITISGMINPAKVLNFFDIAGAWDPSLLLVMFSAMFTAMAGYALVFQRSRPIFEAEFHIPASRTIDRDLVGGSVLFGIGWGICGFCPGGAVPALGLGYAEPAVFFVAMIGGIVCARFLRGLRPTSERAAA